MRLTMKRLVWLGLGAGFALALGGCGKPAAADGNAAKFLGERLTVSSVRGEVKALERALTETLDSLSAAQASGLPLLNGPQVTQLQQELDKLKEMRDAMDLAPAAERVALQEAWAAAEGNLKQLAQRIMSNGAFPADVYGPVLSGIIKELKSLSKPLAS